MGITIIEKDEDSLENNDILFINDDIDNNMAEYVVRFLLEREIKQKHPEHVKMIINSDGGYIDDCMAIIDMMKAVTYPIHTYALGRIYSCGLILAMSGTPGNRSIFKNAMVLSHQWSGGSEGKKHEIEAGEKAHKMNTDKILNLYKVATGLSAEVINKELLPESDVYLSSSQAVKFNLMDKVVTKFQ
jgi:ATP-dependent Clp protease protease subunit